MESQAQAHPVDLYVYDLSSGLASLLSPTLLDGAEEPLVIDTAASDGEPGRRVEGVWHTSVVVFEREFFYGSGGVTSCAPGGTSLGGPLRIDRLGETHVPYTVFLDYLEGLATSTYTGGSYRLLEHNCNHFSDEVASFLCGARLPKAIVQQGEQALPPPLRQAVAALLGGLVPQQQTSAPIAGGVRRVRQESPDYERLNSSIEEASQTEQCHKSSASSQPTDPTSRQTVSWRARLRRGRALLAMVVRAALHPADEAVGAALGARRDALAEKLLRKQRRREAKERKKKGKHEAAAEEPPQRAQMAEALAELSASTGPGPSPGGGSSGPSDTAVEQPDARTAAELRRRELFPPILFTDFDGAQEFEALTKATEGVTLSDEDLQSLDELRQYLVLSEGSWVLGDEFMGFVGRVLQEPSLSSLRGGLLRCLCAAALRDDISLVLHQDRRHHALINHAQTIDRLPPEEQLHIAIFMCNLFANISSSEWLLYISEWEHNGQQISNIRVTTKVCVHTVLSEEPSQRRAGTALLYNLAAKEVKTVRLRETRPLRDLLPKGARAKVFDEVCAELALAALQLASTVAGEGGGGGGTEGPAEECLWRCLAALARLVHHSADVPQLVQMVGPDPNMFRGMSARVDEQIDVIMQRVK